MDDLTDDERNIVATALELLRRFYDMEANYGRSDMKQLYMQKMCAVEEVAQKVGGQVKDSV